MRQLVIQGNVYNYPDPGEDPGWGSDATDWAQAVTDVLNTLVSASDILETSFTVQDDVSSYSNIDGLRFDSALVRAANISYSINRNGSNQSGTLHLNYNTSGSIGNKWTLQENRSGDVGITFSVTDTGQIQYISTNSGFSGQIKFAAKTLSQ